MALKMSLDRHLISGESVGIIPMSRLAAIYHQTGTLNAFKCHQDQLRQQRNKSQDVVIGHCRPPSDLGSLQGRICSPEAIAKEDDGQVYHKEPSRDFYGRAFYFASPFTSTLDRKGEQPCRA